MLTQDTTYITGQEDPTLDLQDLPDPTKLLWALRTFGCWSLSPTHLSVKQNIKINYLKDKKSFKHTPTKATSKTSIIK